MKIPCPICLITNQEDCGVMNVPLYRYTIFILLGVIVYLILR